MYYLKKTKKKKKTLDKTWCRLTEPLVWVQVLVGTNTFKSWCSVSMVRTDIFPQSSFTNIYQLFDLEL